MERQNPDEHERIDVLQHFQQMTDSLIAFLRNAKESIEVCIDPASVPQIDISCSNKGSIAQVLSRINK